MKERHIRLELAQTPASAGQSNGNPAPAAPFAPSDGISPRVPPSSLNQGSLIDVAYRIRENDHPEFGGLEIEIAGIEPRG